MPPTQMRNNLGVEHSSSNSQKIPDAPISSRWKSMRKTTTTGLKGLAEENANDLS